MKAEYRSYCVVSFILSFIKTIKRYALKSTKILIFYLHYLNLDTSINIVHRLLKLSMGILDMIMEGTVSDFLFRS